MSSKERNIVPERVALNTLRLSSSVKALTVWLPCTFHHGRATLTDPGPERLSHSPERIAQIHLLAGTDEPIPKS